MSTKKIHTRDRKGPQLPYPAIEIDDISNALPSEYFDAIIKRVGKSTSFFSFLLKQRTQGNITLRDLINHNNQYTICLCEYFDNPLPRLKDKHTALVDALKVRPDLLAFAALCVSPSEFIHVVRRVYNCRTSRAINLAIRLSCCK